MRYRTIVADPPWDIGQRLGWKDNQRVDLDLPYPVMSTDDIKAIPVRSLSFGDFFGSSRKEKRRQGLPTHDGSHLFLWCTTSSLVVAHDVVRHWGFSSSAVLVWCKEARGFNVGGLFQANVEFVIYARRGAPFSSGVCNSRWFLWGRSGHSQKPEAFLDLVESICPGPYLELFARRNRLGWDTWGDEALEHVRLPETRDRDVAAKLKHALDGSIPASDPFDAGGQVTHVHDPASRSDA